MLHMHAAIRAIRASGPRVRGRARDNHLIALISLSLHLPCRMAIHPSLRENLFSSLAICARVADSVQTVSRETRWPSENGNAYIDADMSYTQKAVFSYCIRAKPCSFESTIMSAICQFLVGTKQRI